MLLLGHRNIDPATLGINIRDYDDDMPVSKKEHGFGGPVAAQNTTGVTDTGVTTGATV